MMSKYSRRGLKFRSLVVVPYQNVSAIYLYRITYTFAIFKTGNQIFLGNRKNSMLFGEDHRQAEVLPTQLTLTNIIGIDSSLSAITKKYAMLNFQNTFKVPLKL